MNEAAHRAVMLNDASCVEDGAHAHGASRVDDRAFADECSLGKFGMAADDGGRVGKHRKLKTQRLELLIEGAPPRGGDDAAQRDRGRSASWPTMGMPKTVVPAAPSRSTMPMASYAPERRTQSRTERQ